MTGRRSDVPIYRSIRSYEEWHQEPRSRETLTVHEDVRAPIATGIFDAAGVMIYRMPEVTQMGFVGKQQPPSPLAKGKPRKQARVASSKAFGLAELGRKIALEQATKAPAK